VIGKEELGIFQRDTPIQRLGMYLRNRGLWDDDRDQALTETLTKSIRAEFSHAETVGPPSPFPLSNYPRAWPADFLATLYG